MGKLVDSRRFNLNGTTINELVAANQRVVVYASDYVELTNSSVYAVDGSLIDNMLLGGVDSEQTRVANQIANFKTADARKAKDKLSQRFSLLSMSGDQPSIPDVAKVEFDPTSVMTNRKACAAVLNIPNATLWCPSHINDYGQLANYYSQIALDAVMTQNLGLPNAIYIAAVDVGGLIRTGTRRLTSGSATSPVCHVMQYTHCASSQPACPAGWSPSGAKEHLYTYDTDGFEHTPCALPWQAHYQCCRDPSPASRGNIGYAYADTLIAYNVRRACGGSMAGACGTLTSLLAARRAAHPLTLWEDPLTGRHSDWPPY